MKFTVSVAVHNNLAYTKACVDSLFRHRGDFELILVDNGSTDGTAEYLRELSAAGVIVITNPSNEGFIRAQNKALKAACGEYFVALNNDTEVSAGWLDKMADLFERNPKLAICGIKGSYSRIDEEGGTHVSLELDYVDGACLMMPRTLALEHGLFSEEYEFAYWEDCDLSLRMKAKGYEIAVVDIPFIHHREATARLVKDFIDLKGYQERNHAVFMRKWGAYLRTRKFGDATKDV